MSGDVIDINRRTAEHPSGTVYDVDTGEIVTSTEIVRPEITSPGAPIDILRVTAQCASVVVWAEKSESIPEIKDASNKLAALGDYLSRTSTDGRGEINAAKLRLEARIGELLGPAEHGGDRKSDQVNRESLDDGLTAQQRKNFRILGADPEAIDDLANASTDDNPVSRRKALDEINRRKNDRTTPPTEAEVKAAERAAAILRAAKRVEKFLDGFDQVVGLTSNPFRDEILESLTDHDRDRLLSIEKELFS